MINAYATVTLLVQMEKDVFDASDTWSSTNY